MNPLTAAIIHMAVGGVAGWLTNGLAVYFLFRPHDPVKIGNVQLSWWRGVIPKRIDALAESIGRLVESDLLTDEVVKDILLSEDTQKFVSSLVLDGAINSLLHDERTLEHIARDVLGISPTTLQETIPQWLHKQATTQLRKDATANVVAAWIGDAGQRLLDTPVAAVTKSELYFNLRYGLRERVRDLIGSGVLKEQLMEAVDRRLLEYETSELSLSQVVPAKAKTQIRRWILAEGPGLADHIVEWLHSPGTAEHLQNIIDRVIAGFPKFGQWIAKRFDKKHDLAGQIVMHLTWFLESPANQKQMLGSISKWLDKLWLLQIGELVRRLGPEKLRNVAELLLDRVLTVRQADAFLDQIDTWLRAQHTRTWREVFTFDESKIDEAISPPSEADAVSEARATAEVAAASEAAPTGQADHMLRKTVAAVLQSEAVADAVGSVIHHLWPRLLTLTPADLASRMRVGDLKRVEAILFATYERVVTNIPPGTVAKLPVAAHVSQHVKSLPLPEVEKQLRRVLDRELRSITLMGLWLGLVVGGLGFFVQLILNR